MLTFTWSGPKCSGPYSYTFKKHFVCGIFEGIKVKVQEFPYMQLLGLQPQLKLLRHQLDNWMKKQCQPHLWKTAGILKDLRCPYQHSQIASPKWQQVGLKEILAAVSGMCTMLKKKKSAKSFEGTTIQNFWRLFLHF